MPRSIVVKPDTCNGRPIFEGTRIPVKTVLGYLAAGESPESIAAEYPALSVEDVYAAIQCAMDILDHNYSFKQVG